MTTTPITVTESVATDLVELCRAGQNLEAIKKLYAPNVVSLEPRETAQVPARTAGVEAVRKKNESWFSAYDIHRHDVEGPFVNEDQFAVRYQFDTTNKRTGERRQLMEVGVYTVKDGKIVQERFFDYTPDA